MFPMENGRIKMDSRPSPQEITMSSVNSAQTAVSDSRSATCRFDLCKIADDLLSHILHSPKNLSTCPSQ